MMYKSIVAILVSAFAANIIYAQLQQCKEYPDPLPVISADSIAHLCFLGANPGNGIEVKWHQTEPIMVQLGPNSKESAQSSVPGISVWDVEQNIGLSGDDLIDPSYTQLELSSDSIILGTNTGNLIVSDLMRTAIRYNLFVSDGEVSELLLHPSAEWLLVVINSTRLFRVILESQTVSEIHLDGSEEFRFQAMAFSSDGRLLAAAGNGVIGVWDTGSWEAWEPRTLSVERITKLHFADDGFHLIVLADASVSRWSLIDKQLEFMRELTSHPDKRPCHFTGGDVSPDGGLLITTDTCLQFRNWNLHTDEEIFVPRLHNSSDYEDSEIIALSRDGRFLYRDWGSANFSWVLLIINEPK